MKGDGVPGISYKTRWKKALAGLEGMCVCVWDGVGAGKAASGRVREGRERE